MRPRHVDLLLVFHDATLGLGVVHEQLLEALRGQGADVYVARSTGGRADVLKVGYPLIDLVEAASLRHAADHACARVTPEAIIYETPTALLLEPEHRLRKAAVRFDASSPMNRLGWRNGWQRTRQQHALRNTRLLLPATTGALAWAQAGFGGAVPLFSPIVDVPAAAGPRKKAVTCYAGDPAKKGLDLAVMAWNHARMDDYELEIVGLSQERGERFLRRRGLKVRGSVTWHGRVSPDGYRALSQRNAIHLATPRYDEYAAAQLEALSDGPLLVTATPEWGPYEALGLAAQLQPRLVAEARTPESIAACLRRAASVSVEGLDRYRSAARKLLEPYRQAAFERQLRDVVLPRLLEPAQGLPPAARAGVPRAEMSLSGAAPVLTHRSRSDD